MIYQTICGDILDSKEEINQIAADFSVDKVTYIPQNNHYKVRLGLGKGIMNPLKALESHSQFTNPKIPNGMS
jgi:hypothetical protein